jgi:hypothetical protein
MSDTSIWENTQIQAVRLVSEIMATQDNLDMDALSESMDLDIEDLQELMDRIHESWEKVKWIVCPVTHYYVVQDKKGGKYADGYYGWDSNIHSDHQIFREDELPFKFNDDMNFIVVGKGSRPSPINVMEFLQNRLTSEQ